MKGSEEPATCLSASPNPLANGSGAFEASFDDFCPGVSYPLGRGQYWADVSIKLHRVLTNLADCDFLVTGP